MFHRPALRFALTGFVALSIAAVSAAASAKDIIVHMKNQGAEGAMVFEPSFVKAAPGDVIHFKPTDLSHNAETMATMWPAGAAPMKGMMNKEAVMTVTKPGLYGVKCLPHYAMGMVALVQVGKATPADITAAKAVKLPPFAAKRMTAMLAKVK